MITITFSNSHMVVVNNDGETSQYTLDHEAYSHGDYVGVRHARLRDIEIFKGRVLYSGVSLDGVTYDSAAEFVTAFNEMTGVGIGYNTKYPSGLFSQHISPTLTMPTQVVPLWCINGHNGGYVTIKAPSGNTGNIYVGESDVSTGSFALEPGQSITLEISDLSLIYIMANTVGDHADVIGVAKV